MRIATALPASDKSEFPFQDTTWSRESPCNLSESSKVNFSIAGPSTFNLEGILLISSTSIQPPGSHR